MAAMAMSEQSVPLAVEIRKGSQGLAWVLWIVVSVLGGIVGALVAWRIRSLIVLGAPALLDALRYIATIIGALVPAGAQWFLLRRYRFDVYWWVPASVTANLLADILVIPSVLRLFVYPSQLGPTSASITIMAGAAALAAAGLVIGAAQAAVLHSSRGNIAWAWIPATVIGLGLAGGLTSALSFQLFGLPAFVTISLVAAVGALLVSASQAPVLYRLSS